MDLIKQSLEQPVSVVVGVILLVLFGLISLSRMPYQLSPSVIEPEITVTTVWLGATPYEVEREIIEEQEKVLKGIPGLYEMESSSYDGSGVITLRFKVGVDVDNALLRVSNKLSEVRSYPQNAERPVINATGAATSPVIWMVMKAREGNHQSVYNARTYFEDEIRQYLERVEGVADLFVGGGREQELHVEMRDDRLAAYGVTVSELIRALDDNNVNIAAGTMGVGRRDYRIRTVGEAKTPADVASIVVRSNGDEWITIGDLARVHLDYAPLTDAMLHNGDEGIAIGIKPEPDVNVLSLTDRMEAVVRDLNDNTLQSENLRLEWVYDQRPYILGAIQLVKDDILVGGILAVGALLLFLRRISPTLVVALTIPVSIIGTFILLHLLGRNLNVISLAGISFSVGMLVDNAIVVIENIERHRSMGKDAVTAAYDGTREVWAALLLNTFTAVAVFLPVIFIEEEVGQLFRDIAIAVSASQIISFYVSVLTIPTLVKWLAGFGREKRPAAVIPSRPSILVRFGTALSEGYMALVRLALTNGFTRLFTVVFWIGFCSLLTVLLFPKMEYLPQGNRNLVINILIPPPGLSYEERYGIGRQIYGQVEPHMRRDADGMPGIKNIFYVGAERIMLFGAISTHEQRAAELIPFFTRIIQSIPGVFGISNQAGVFQTTLGRGRTIDVDLTSEDVARTVQAGGALFGAIMQKIPGSQVRPVPSLEITYPEIRFAPERDRLQAAGLSARDLGHAIDVLMDGRKVGEFKQEGKKKIDLVLTAEVKGLSTPEELAAAPIRTPTGQVVPVSSLAAVTQATGTTEFRHLERQRTITLQVTPPTETPLEQAMDTIRGEIVPELRTAGMLNGIEVSLSGTADKLTEARQALQWNFLLASMIIYLLMSAMFSSFIYPLLIMSTIPLAGAGGFLGLALVSRFIAPQPLDILTMLGFVILVGVVVNNAILIVYQALNYIRDEGYEPREAVLESTRTRLRPIYMTAAASVLGMLPLVVAPGPGSELYRGLGSVLLGGLVLSTVLTIFVIPSLLLFFIGREKKREKTG
ncbi:MAG: efflux RND transporter permease subunit [Deltaproteobacteria bacterium]|nr:efflux RND transporter permease subunit [Deltaproteobacteria bacterium]